MSQFYNNSVFWIDVDKIKSNPYQPRREFDEQELKSLADSIRQYGVLQALVVTRQEVQKPDGGLDVEYELIAGERRLRASKLAGLREVPVLIRAGAEDNLMKLELAIIENVQREDLNPIERAKAFKQLSQEFKLTHEQIGKKVGKSRAFVTNTIRILDLPEIIIVALAEKKINEGHTRPLGMLNDRPAEQETLLKEIIFKKLNVREAEKLSRRVAQDKVRRNKYRNDPEVEEIQKNLAESLGMRVSIERYENGGVVSIDFFSNEELKKLFDLVRGVNSESAQIMAETSAEVAENPEIPQEGQDNNEEDLYSVQNFSV